VIRVLVRCDHPRGKGAAARLRRRAREFLSALGRDGAELSLSLVGDAEIRALNRSWRGKDAATDVLSFPLSEPPAGAMLGDVVISLDTAARVAREGGRDVGAELDRYLAHGILHLLGHDHEKPRDAREMAATEERLLSADGLVSAALAPPRRGAARARPPARPAARPARRAR
jgi:probable rRNA maturation factor